MTVTVLLSEAVADNTISFSTVNVGDLTATVPSCLVDCFDFLFDGRLPEGAFRVSGSTRRMKLMATDDTSYKEWLFHEKKPSPHDVCGIIKKFLREYLVSLNGLFCVMVLSRLQRVYLSHLRSGSAFSMDSFKSANTTFGSRSLSSVLSEDDVIFDHDSLLDAVAHLLVSKNLASKNMLFFYLLTTLKRLSTFEETTKMTVSNQSIIFQPYIFNTTNLSELKPFQALLTFLVINSDSLLDKYTCYNSLLGGLDKLDTENVSAIFSESTSTSPVTVYSSDNISSKNEPSRRSSLTHRFSVFLDNYNLPANRSKRFSMNFGTSRLNVDKMAENEGDSVSPHSKSFESLVSNTEAAPALEVSQSQAPRGEPLEKRKSSKRMSFYGLFKATSSGSVQDLVFTTPASVLTPPVRGFSSVDDLLQSGKVSSIEPKRLIRRGFSMRLKRR